MPGPSVGGWPSPPDHVLKTRRSSSRRPAPDPTNPRPALHPLASRETRRLPAPPTPIGSCVIGRERAAAVSSTSTRVTFQRTKTWKASNDPRPGGQVSPHRACHRTPFPDRVFAFDEFGPLTIRPHPGAGWAPNRPSGRQPANYHKLPRGPPVPRLLFGRRGHPVGRRPPTRSPPANTLAALQVHPGRPSGRGADLRHLGQPVRPPRREDPRLGAPEHRSSCASPRPTPPGPTPSRRTSVRCGPSPSTDSNHPNHTVPTRALHEYLRWRNANARHPDLLAAQRRERARIRSERRHRWGQPRHPKSRMIKPSQRSWTEAPR